MALLSRLRALLNGHTPSTPPRFEGSAALQIADNDSIEPCSFSQQMAREGFYNTVIGPVDARQPLTAQQKLIIAGVEKSLKNQPLRIKAVPRLPSVIPKLLRSLRDPNAAARDFVNIINKDPALSTSVLKLANSVYFNPASSEVTSIETAVVKLGLQGLRTVLSTAVMQPVIQQKSNFYTEFGHKLWVHSTSCAAACEIIAKQRQLEPFKAYLLGLVHDIGKITLFSQLSSQFNQHEGQDRPGAAAFTPLMQPYANELTATIARDWALPEELCDALQQQVNPTDSTMTPYAHVLYQANLSCEMYAICQQDDSQQACAEQTLAAMQLPTDLFAKLDAIATQG